MLYLRTYFPYLFRISWHEYVLIFLCIFHFFANLVWILLNIAPQPWDQAGHTILTYKFTDYFLGLDPSLEFFKISFYYPPLIYNITAFLMMIFGKSEILGPLVVTGFFLTSIVFLYLYTYELFRSKAVSLTSAAILSFTPYIFGLSRYYLLEIPLLAFILASLYFLEKTNNFNGKKYTYIFAISFGLSLMVKWTAIVFLSVPLIIKIFQNLEFLKTKLFLKSLFLILLINFFWYFTNFADIQSFSKITMTPESSDPQNLFSFQNYSYYLYLLTNYQLTFFGMGLFLISLMTLISSKIRLSLVLNFVFIYLVFTFIGNKDWRYPILLTPIAVIIISKFLISGLQKTKLFIPILAVTALYFLIYYGSLSFGFPIDPFKNGFRRTISIPYFGEIHYINFAPDTSFFLAPKYNPVNWPNDKIADELSYHNLVVNLKILLICEKPFMNQPNMEVSRRKLGKDKIEFDAPYRLSLFKNAEEVKEYLSDFGVILLAQKDMGFKDSVRHYPVMEQLKKYIQNGSDKTLIKINSYPLPDGDILIVYKNTNWEKQNAD